MKRNVIAAAAALMIAGASMGIRAKTNDVAFAFRMGAGFIGDVNRTSPSSILPSLLDTTNPVRLYGDPVYVNTAANTVRGFLAGDTALTRLDGVLVRPYPTQQASGGMSSTIGAASPPTPPAVVDVIRQGFVLVKCNNFAVTPSTKGGTVYIWIAANSGNHVQGGFEAASSGSTITITNARFNGPPDAAGVCELEVWAG